MKKTVSLLVLVALCFGLFACSGNVDGIESYDTETERLIAAIGTVTLDSGKKLEEARNSYYYLSEEKKTEISNYEDLERAMSQYDSLLSEYVSGLSREEALVELRKLYPSEEVVIARRRRAVSLLRDYIKEKGFSCDILGRPSDDEYVGMKTKEGGVLVLEKFFF